MWFQKKGTFIEILEAFREIQQSQLIRESLQQIVRLVYQIWVTISSLAASLKGTWLLQ
jgi:hypothetical protein